MDLRVIVDPGRDLPSNPVDPGGDLPSNLGNAAGRSRTVPLISMSQSIATLGEIVNGLILQQQDTRRQVASLEAQQHNANRELAMFQLNPSVESPATKNVTSEAAQTRQQIEQLRSWVEVRIQQLESTVLSQFGAGAGAGSRAGADQSPAPQVAASTKDNGEAIEQALMQDEIKISASSWEVGAFLGSAGFGKAGSVFIVVLALLNVIVQLCFCAAAYTSLTDDDFDKEMQSEFLEWRLRAHHIQEVDRTLGETLVERVCKMDASLNAATKQLDVREVIDRYTRATAFGMPAGSVVCMLALMFWYLAIMTEVNAMYDYLVAIMHVPTGQLEIEVADDGTLQLIGLDSSRKMLCFAITLVRFIIAGFLAYVGTLSTVFTNSVGDLLLNAMALELVLNVDEYLFSCMGPSDAQKFLNQLKPIGVGRRLQWHGVSLHTFSGFVIVPLALVTVYYIQVQPHSEDIQAVEDTLCSGNTRFGYAVSAAGFPHATEEFGANMYGLDMQQVVLDAIKLASVDDVPATSVHNMILWERHVAAIDQISSVLDPELAFEEVQDRCNDLLASWDCTDPILHVVNGNCPPGYMDPRDATECRSASIALGIWNQSAQEQPFRSKSEADVVSPFTGYERRPCEFLEQNRTIWTGTEYQFYAGCRGADCGQGPCICQPKEAKMFQRAAELYSGIPGQSCSQLADAGACALEKPVGSGSMAFAKAMRFLCPEACGCNLLPRSPLRTVICPISCYLMPARSSPDRTCTDLSPEQLKNTPQMKHFKEDFWSMKEGRSTYPYAAFIEDLETRGCNAVKFWGVQLHDAGGVPIGDPPYDFHGDPRNISGPACNTFDTGQQQISCLALRCQDFDPAVCSVTMTAKDTVTCDDMMDLSNLDSYQNHLNLSMMESLSAMLARIQSPVWMWQLCPKTCNLCARNLWKQLFFQPGLCEDVWDDPWSGKMFNNGFRNLFRGFCPMTCNCPRRLELDLAGAATPGAAEGWDLAGAATPGAAEGCPSSCWGAGGK